MTFLIDCEGGNEREGQEREELLGDGGLAEVGLGVAPHGPI